MSAPPNPACNSNSGPENGVKVEGKWRPLREGEMSPYKMLVALFIREVYSEVHGRSKNSSLSLEEGRGSVSPKTLLLIYNLITSYDLDSYAELKALLDRPSSGVRHEALKRFNRIVANLEPHNSYFLYELANSIVTMEASQMVVLKKRISKSSPFGKFLRRIYLNVKKLSYPQVDFMYKQLLEYLGIFPGMGSLYGHGSLSKGKELKVPRSLKGLDLFQKFEERTKSGVEMELFNPYLLEYRKMMGSESSSEREEFCAYAAVKAERIKTNLEKCKTLRQTWTNPCLIPKEEKGNGMTPRRDTDTILISPVERSSPDTPDVFFESEKRRTRRSPRSKPEPLVSVKRITRSTSSPLTKGIMPPKRRSSSLRRLYLSSPRPNPVTSSSPNVAAAAVSTPVAGVASTASPSRVTRASAAAVAAAAAASSSTVTATSDIKKTRHHQSIGLPIISSNTPKETKIVNTGAFKIRQHVRSDPEGTIAAGTSTSGITQPIIKKEQARGRKPHRTGEARKTTKKHAIEPDGDVVMKSLSPVKPSFATPKKSPRLSARKLSSPAAASSSSPVRMEVEGDVKPIPSTSTGVSTPAPAITTRGRPVSSLSLRELLLREPKVELVPVDKGLKPKPKKISPTAERSSLSSHPNPNMGWDIIKRWSRKQIEKAVRSLVKRLYSSNSAVPWPSEVTHFVNLALRNPSAGVLAPHLHYLEYLNSLRTKDVTRCGDSLRSSFDVRIKPSTSELTKGTTYAAYNSALFYSQLGYRKDALAFLEEAFRAGHAVGDALCLHHCHNLWSSFQSKAYTDAIVTVTKEVDNNMAYLHSLNVIVNAFDIHNTHGLSPDEILRSLWNYNVDCDIEEMEGLLLSALSNFYAIYGWHEMISFPSQMILHTQWKWSSRFYSFGLCSLSQSLLFHGEVDIANEVMNYGREIFQFDISPVGGNFVLQNAIFESLKCYLAYEPVPPSVVSTIEACDKHEATYWRSYNLMMKTHFREAADCLGRFLVGLNNNSNNTCMLGFALTDLKLRCLMLLAELECLGNNPTSAVTHISEALDLATTIHADVYITLCLFYAASVQCELGLLKTSSITMEKKMRSALRSGSPWLRAKTNIIKAKILTKSGEITADKFQEISKLLDDSEQLFTKWGNKYRLKEVWQIKSLLFDRYPVKGIEGSSLRERISGTHSTLPWSPKTCIL